LRQQFLNPESRQVTVIAIGRTPLTTPNIKHPAKFSDALQVAMSQSG
jgi:hypothetical protein